MRNNHSNFESRTEKDIYEAPNPGTQNSSRYDLWQRLAREREQSQVGPETVRDLIPRPPFDNHLRIVEKPLPVVVLRRNRNPSLDAENDHLEKQLRGYRNDGAIVEKPLPVVLRRNRNGNPSLDAENDHLEKQLRGYRNDGAYENSDIEKILKTATPVLTEHEREIFSDLQKIENRIRQGEGPGIDGKEYISRIKKALEILSPETVIELREDGVEFVDAGDPPKKGVRHPEVEKRGEELVISIPKACVKKGQFCLTVLTLYEYKTVKWI